MSLGKGSADDSSPDDAVPDDAVPDDAGPDVHAPAAGRVLDASALKAYAHPLRVRMLRYLGDHEAATATDLARFLGESTGQTSYHLRQLAKHGLVEDVPDRGTKRERWWKATSFSVDAATMRQDPATATAAKTLLSAVVQDRADSLDVWVTGTWDPAWAEVALHDKRTLHLVRDELVEMTQAVQEVLDRYAAISRARKDGSTATPPGVERVRTYFDAFPLLVAAPEPPVTGGG